MPAHGARSGAAATAAAAAAEVVSRHATEMHTHYAIANLAMALVLACFVGLAVWRREFEPWRRWQDAVVALGVVLIAVWMVALQPVLAADTVRACGRQCHAATVDSLVDGADAYAAETRRLMLAAFDELLAELRPRVHAELKEAVVQFQAKAHALAASHTLQQTMSLMTLMAVNAEQQARTAPPPPPEIDRPPPPPPADAADAAANQHTRPPPAANVGGDDDGGMRVTPGLSADELRAALATDDEFTLV
jgi:hypothetical protein